MNHTWNKYKYILNDEFMQLIFIKASDVLRESGEHMIDIHSHIIFGIDDGPSNIEQSVEMVGKAEKAGVRTIVATPHSHDKLFGSDRIFENYQEILYRIRDFGVTLKLGYEVFIHPAASGMVKASRALTLDNGSCLLFEVPFNCTLTEGYNIILNFRLESITPIIAHLERNRNFLKNNKDIGKYVKAGCMIQIDMASIIGVYGRGVKDFAKILLKYGLVSFVASNAHCAEDYEKWYLAAYREVVKLIGEESANRLVLGNAESILNKEAIIQAV